MLGVTTLVGPLGCQGNGAQSSHKGRSGVAQGQWSRAPSAQRGRDGDGTFALLLDMRGSLAMFGEKPWGEVLVSVESLRNQSHSSTGEFERLLERLATTLSRAGSTGGVPLRFVLRSGEPVDYELTGTAYLMTAAGFDQWELYLNLRAAGREWTIWSADGPVLMLRQPRGGVDRIYLKKRGT